MCDRLHGPEVALVRLAGELPESQEAIAPFSIPSDPRTPVYLTGQRFQGWYRCVMVVGRRWPTCRVVVRPWFPRQR